jgi:hypothetical protein
MMPPICYLKDCIVESRSLESSSSLGSQLILALINSSAVAPLWHIMISPVHHSTISQLHEASITIVLL